MYITTKKKRTEIDKNVANNKISRNENESDTYKRYMVFKRTNENDVEAKL